MIDLCIIGTGPAGATCAIYAFLSGIENIKIFAGEVPGGQLTTTSTVDNFPGLYGISGGELAEKLLDHIQKYTEIVYEFVESVEENDGYLLVKTNVQQYKTKYLVIASGSSPKKLPVQNIINLENKGVSYCHVCDGFLFRKKDVAVVGGGNSACEAAIYLSKICSKVYLIHRRSEFRALKDLQTKVFELVTQGKIELILDSEVIDAKSDDKGMCGIVVQTKDQKKTINVFGLFIHIGHNPQTKFVKNLINLDEEGHILVNRNQASSHKKIFACGDCCVFSDGFKKFKQAVNAAAEGTNAALIISELLNKNN